MGSTIFPTLDLDGSGHLFAGFWTTGAVELQFQRMAARPFDDLAARRELLRRFNAIDGVALPEARLAARPN